MKNILLLVLTAFVFLGCTKKLETDVQPYIILHQNAKQNIKIDSVGINDKRVTKIASTMFDKEKIYKEYPLNIDVKTWYTDAMMREFKNTNILLETTKPNITVEINIKNISAKYKRYSMDTKNMKANVHLELIITKDGIINTSQIEINQTLYKPMILDAAGFESIINESMRDSVSKTVSILIKKIKG